MNVNNYTNLSMSDQIGLFEQSEASPWAFELRPSELEEFYGQKSLMSKVNSLDLDNLPHIIFYGPPGVGKTTLVHILAKKSERKLYNFNAVLGGVNDLREIIKKALAQRDFEKKAIIFIDEIHRFNKAQQDALLPYLEEGNFILFGATTETPQVTLNKAIISRVKLFKLNELETHEVIDILNRAVKIKNLDVPESIIKLLGQFSNGDARSALSNLELLLNQKKPVNFDDLDAIKELLSIHKSYDRNSDRHYDVISAFIKSVRGSDVDAAILWLAVMLDGGEDIAFIARRLIILASEDIGNADPRALQLATSCHYAIKQIGMPEARIILAQTTTYLANSPKSNASYLAIDAALEYVKNNPTIEVPTHLRNRHPDKSNYKYPHSFQNHWVSQNYLNDDLEFFRPTGLGYERIQKETLNKMKGIHD